MNADIKDRLEAAFRDISIQVKDEPEWVATLNKESVVAALAFLKDAGFDHLSLVSCVDWMDQDQFEIVYILSSYLKTADARKGQEKLKVILKTRIAREKPRFQTVTHIFENAEPYERELHELYGIHFEGHPRLMPLFLERDYAIPPFRKDFDTREYVKDVFEKIPPVEVEKK